MLAVFCSVKLHDAVACFVHKACCCSGIVIDVTVVYVIILFVIVFIVVNNIALCT